MNYAQLGWLYEEFYNKILQLTIMTFRATMLIMELNDLKEKFMLNKEQNIKNRNKEQRMYRRLYIPNISSRIYWFQ